jgi:hypothetical protein
MRTLLTRLVFGAALLACGCASAGRSSQTVFDSPEAAVEAMFKAATASDTTALLAIFGPESREVLMPADAVQARREREVMVAAMIERWWLDGEGNTRTVVIGNENFPMAIPLVQEQGKWRFDTAAGKEELLFRRIGRNELAVIEVAEAYVDAQKEYAAQGHDGAPKGAYAQRILSDDGKQNGLYWPTKPGEAPSPMGDMAAKAAADGYRKSERSNPYHGYYFKVLKEQGANAAGGPRSWIEGDAMTGGFGLLAWPAEYRASGVMTFLVGPDGVVRQKDLGEATPTLAESIKAFDPDQSWAAQQMP